MALLSEGLLVIAPFLFHLVRFSLVCKNADDTIVGRAQTAVAGLLLDALLASAQRFATGRVDSPSP